MHNYTRIILAAMNKLAAAAAAIVALGVRFRAWLIAHHCAALAAMVDKADDAVSREISNLDTVQKIMASRIVAAQAKANTLAAAATAEAAKHGVSLDL